MKFFFSQVAMIVSSSQQHALDTFNDNVATCLRRPAKYARHRRTGAPIEGSYVTKELIWIVYVSKFEC